MSRITSTFALAIVAGVLSLGITGTASAQDTPPLTKRVAVTGTKGFKGTYTIKRFVQKGDSVVAVGSLSGTMKGKKVRRSNVRRTVSLAAVATGSQIPPTRGACQVLNLTINPIDLNLLGLRVRLSRVDLRIEAIPSGVPGSGLLGDLLCGITNLLNPGANSPLSAVTQLLNALIALVPTSPASACRSRSPRSPPARRSRRRAAPARS